MAIIALVNQKGGVGKTTTAIHLSDWISKKGSVILVDADAQQSSTPWAKSLDIPCLTLNDPEDLFDRLQELNQEYENVVVDGPGGMSEVSKSILARCDLTLVPCQPSGLDLRSADKTLRFIRQSQEIRGGKPHAFLFLNRSIKRTVLSRDAEKVLTDLSIPFLKTVIYQRQCITEAPGQGTTAFRMGAKGKEVAADYKRLFVEAMRTLNEQK